MKQLVTLQDPFQGVHSIKIYEPQRGVGGTTAFPVVIDDIATTFELNDDCNWESDLTNGKLNREVISFISHQLEQLTA